MAEEDIMWGKKRHLYGGIEPSNMLEFKATYDPPGSDFVKIIATLPNDTIIDGQMICSVGGAMIRRKLTGYPVDEFDGEEVYDIKNSTEFIDMETEANGTYFYAAFPYSTQGVYNRSITNRASVNEPGDMVVFTTENAYSSEVGVQIKLTYELPEGVAGAYICKSTTRYPKDENDGRIFVATSSGVYMDADVTAGTMVYYAAFPYSATGIVNRNIVNRTSRVPVAGGYIFGFDLDTNDSNPKTRVTYPSDVDNAEYTPAAMDFSSDTFNYGDWPSEAGKHFMPRPCVIKYDTGEIQCYLDPNNYTKTADGESTGIDDSSNTDKYFMMEWPKIYTHRELVNGIYKFRCSDRKVADDWECWCNYDINNNVIDHFYTAIYGGRTYSSRLLSVKNHGVSVNGTFSDCVTRATKNGDGWYIEQIADRLLVQDLLVMMAKSTDCQTAYGMGNTGSGTYDTDTSALPTKGLFWGESAGKECVKVFGMEHYWGNYRRWVAGYICKSGKTYMKITRGTHDGTSVSDYNITGTGYKTIIGNPTIYAGSGYIKEMTIESYGRIPYDAGGSDTTYETDTLYGDVNKTACAMMGGYLKSGSAGGPFHTYLFYTGDETPTNGHVIAALSYKPTAKN